MHVWMSLGGGEEGGQLCPSGLQFPPPKPVACCCYSSTRRVKITVFACCGLYSGLIQNMLMSCWLILQHIKTHREALWVIINMVLSGTAHSIRVLGRLPSFISAFCQGLFIDSQEVRWESPWAALPRSFLRAVRTTTPNSF